MTKKIFPFATGNSPFNSFKLVLISEGYLASESSKFASDCQEFTFRLVQTSPFNMSRSNARWLSIYTIFTASNNSGPSIDAPAGTGRTAFESSVNTHLGTLTVNIVKFKAFVNVERLSVKGEAIPLSEFCAEGIPTYGNTGTLIVLLLPSGSSGTLGGELEYNPGLNDYHFVATSCDGEWQQVIFRGIAKCLGLGDEFELPGNDFLEPPLAARKYVPFFNLEYFSVPPITNDASIKWRSLLGATQRKAQPIVHAKTSNIATPDNTYNSFPMTPERIEYWEGGGGFRTHIYRTAKDCLMRRRIGDQNLPVRSQHVAFCIACRKFLEGIIS